MIKVKTILILLYSCLLLSGCAKDASVGNELYIPSGYKNELEMMKMTEIAPMRYFKSPFITVAKDYVGNQFAVIFREDGKVDKVILPETYENIVGIYETKGCKIEKYSQGFSNLHLFESNGELYWNFTDGEKDIYLNLQGKEEDPFRKETEGGS